MKTRNHRRKFLLGAAAVLALSSGFVKTSLAQSFDKDGVYHPKTANDGLYNPLNLGGTKTPPLLLIPSLSQTKADAKTLKSYHDRILERINRAIYNLQDDSLELKRVYGKIWPNFYSGYLGDLQALKKYLDDPAHVAAPTLGNLPSAADFQALASKDLYDVKALDQLSTTDQLAFALIKSDALSERLRTQYLSDLSNDLYFKNQEMDMSYVGEWRQLEAWYTQTRLAAAYAKSMAENIFKFDQKVYQSHLDRLKAIDLSKLILPGKISQSTFMKKWLWYTSGIPMINPLQVSTAEKRYPLTERNSYLTVNQQKLQDTLNKSGLLEKFGQTSKYYNLLYLPQRSRQNKDSIALIEYNGRDQYKPFATKPENALNDKYKLMLAVYNIPASKKISIASSVDKLVYESEAVVTLNTIADQIGTLTSFSTSAGIFNKLSARINMPSFPSVPPKVGVPANGSLQQSAAKADNAQEKFSKPFKDTVIAIPVHPDTPGRRISFALINGHYIPVTGKDQAEDKKRVLYAGFLKKDGNESTNSYNQIPIQIITEFVKRDRAVFLDYENRAVFNAGLESLNRRFNKFKNFILSEYKQLNTLTSIAETQFLEVEPFVRIINRSLPPTAIKETIDTIPELRTVLKQPTTPDAPAKLNYTITEAPASGKGVTRDVVKSTLNVIQTQRFDFSVGLGYTFREYAVSSDGSPLPVSTIGDQFQFQAGAHWYPYYRLNKLHDGFFTKYWKERFSVYAGLSIAHALDNYFTGISCDIVPGVRLIGGCHFYRNYRYKIVNNSVADKASGISTAGFFLSFNLEPVSVAKAIGLFK